MAFIMQSESVTAQGVALAGLGYGDENDQLNKGIHNSIAVEFDTHKGNVCMIVCIVNNYLISILIFR
jgi:hypothetical protein